MAEAMKATVDADAALAQIRDIIVKAWPNACEVSIECTPDRIVADVNTRHYNFIQEQRQAVQEITILKNPVNMGRKLGRMNFIGGMFNGKRKRT